MSLKFIILVAVIVVIAIGAAVYLISNPQAPPISTPQPTTTQQTASTPSTATTPQYTTSPQYITIKDVLGREVQIKLPVKRVVAIGPGALRLIVYLNATDKLAGIEAIEKRPPQGRDYGYVLWAKN
ncbi:MAG: iron ABC transporter substrate-binding protein, partial [Thermoproteus sp.]